MKFQKNLRFGNGTPIRIRVKYLKFRSNVRLDVSPLADDIVVTAGGDVLLIFKKGNHHAYSGDWLANYEKS